MRRLSLSLRTTVVLSLAVLMGAAMLLSGALMLSVYRRDLLAAKVDEGFVLIQAVEQLYRAHYPWPEPESDIALRDALQELSSRSGWQLQVVDHRGSPVYPGQGQAAGHLERLLRLGEQRVILPAARPGLWLSLPEKVVLEAPLHVQGAVRGGMRLQTSLADLRRSFGSSQRLVLAYTAIYLLVLLAFGTYLLSRLVVDPVRRLVKVTEQFQEGDRLPEVTGERSNELATLGQALNRMLARLAENRQQLEHHVRALEQVNRELLATRHEVIVSEKMASVGRLAAGIAHEIGNPMGIVIGYLELLRRDDLDPEERQDLLERMGKELARMHATIRQLLDFSRPSDGERRPLSVHQVLEETLGMLRHRLEQQQITVAVEKAATTDTVRGDPDQLQQVFVNVLLNAADALAAMSKGAETKNTWINIRTMVVAGSRAHEPELPSTPSRRRSDPPAADFRHLRRTPIKAHRGPWLEVRVEDNGPGIEPEDLPRVFDPFFTTKEVGQGTGLGLAVSLRIVESMGGRLQIDSQAGEGTTVRMLLPLEEFPG